MSLVVSSDNIHGLKSTEQTEQVISSAELGGPRGSREVMLPMHDAWLSLLSYDTNLDLQYCIPFHQDDEVYSRKDGCLDRHSAWREDNVRLLAAAIFSRRIMFPA